MFGEKPKEWASPAEHGDHPEVDTSAFFDSDGTRQYMSLLGAMQWAISLCRFDIATAVMTLGRFRVAPRVSTCLCLVLCSGRFRFVAST
jgi:hypothetical protein